RSALIETLSSDPEIGAKVLEGFDDTESCYRALVNALSFQLRDDIDFRNKDITKDHFVDGALNRTSLADWDLVERAFELLDEIRNRRASIYALSHAADFIEQSGNTKAIEENRKLESGYGKKKEDFTQKSFEEYIKQQADKDNVEDVKRAVAGYYALTEREKNLFFTVLSSRDLLDVSRKDYKKSFFGIKDRDYVNQAGRDKLIDRYIESSLEGNVGITVGAGIHYDAMKMLFSTQISDRERFDTDKSIESMMVVERNLFMGRATAIDWKLFKRALCFVNRASEELEYAEGNAQLYRGAGNLWEQGRLDISYSFLRKNFHRTGNQWGRYLGRLFIRTVKEELHYDVLDTLVDTVDYLELSAKYVLPLKEDGLTRKGIAWLKKQATESKRTKNALLKANAVDFNLNELKTKSSKPSGQSNKDETPQMNQNYFEAVKQGIDDIYAVGTTLSDAMQQSKQFLRDRLISPLANHFNALKFFEPENEVKATADKNNLVEQFSPTTGKEDKRSDVQKSFDKVSDNSQYAMSAWKFAEKMPFTKSLTKLIKYTAEKAAYKYFFGKNFDDNQDLNIFGKDQNDEQALEKQKLMQKEIDDYVAIVFKDLLDSTIGEKHAGKLLFYEEILHATRNPVTKTISSVIYKLNYAKKCISHAENITACISNSRLLNNNAKAAINKREEDNAKLKRANERRLSDEQAKQVKDIVDKHRAIASLGQDLTDAILGFNIVGEALNFAIETANVAGNKLNVGEYVISKAIKEGLQFALFALRIASDRKSLADYYLHTEAGKSMVDRIRGGFIKAGNNQLVGQLDDAISRQKTLGVSSLVDIISDARGYEHTSELAENTGMSIAQSIVFCASGFNPMAETKLMAITVMSVMGLGSEIGSTSPETVEKLFNSFRLAR
ncbi:MAG: hypothetical protein K6E91_03920, partial [Butyrivibrio sp.]|nr:hypothetical protein [Butyrivibrio sp.]